MSPAFKLHGALFTVALLFSANYIVSKVGLEEFSPLLFAWLRVAGAAVVLWILARGEQLPKSASRRAVLYAILGVAINQTLFLSGLAFTTVQVAAILITSIPVFALAAAIALGRERATASGIGGIALACAGALLVVGGEGVHGTGRSLGAALILLNCLSYSLYLVLSKPDMAHLPVRALVARMFAWGTLLMFPAAAVPLWRAEWTGISGQAWGALVLVILGPTVAAYVLQAWALRHAASSSVAAYTYLQPVLATFLAAILFGERVRPIVIVAAAMIFTGVWIAGRRTM